MPIRGEVMFAKIFSQIFDSSIASDHLVRHVFMDMLVLADRDGVVDMTSDALSRRTNVPLELITYALQKLSEPDSSSRSRDEEGRRIVLIDSHRDWGWQLVNYHHYRNLLDDEARRAYFRDRKREQRKREKSVKNVLDSQKRPMKSTKVTQAEAEVDTDLKSSADLKSISKSKRSLSLASVVKNKKERESPPLPQTKFPPARTGEPTFTQVFKGSIPESLPGRPKPTKTSPPAGPVDPPALAQQVWLAYPKNSHLQPYEVPASAVVQLLPIFRAEATRAETTQTDAALAIITLIGEIAAAVKAQPGQEKYLPAPEKFFAEHQYRLPPQHFIRANGGNANGHKSHNQRVLENNLAKLAAEEADKARGSTAR